jgi:hypothetical protein
MTTMIALPFVCISREQYDFLLFSRNVLGLAVILLGIALYDRVMHLRVSNNPNNPKDDAQEKSAS